MINCAIYPRKSKAVDNSDSMDVQIDMCRRYLDDKYGPGNYTTTIYDGDYGITGHSTKNRKDFQRMMQDIFDKKIQLVVIQRYDRIARNTRDFCNLYHDMEINGCNLVSVSQQIDTTTPYGKNFMYMQASMAELEWALNSERRKDAIKYSVSIGKSTFPNKSVPFGYKNEYVDGMRRLVKDPDKEEIVYAIYDSVRKYSTYTKTARDINKKYGTTFTTNKIKKIIKSEFHKGKYKDNLHFCEPYLTEKEWDELQIKRPSIRFDCTPNQEILFNGFLVCPVCGRILNSRGCRRKSGNIYRYYNCNYHVYGMCTNNKVKAESLIETMLCNYIDSYLNAYTSNISATIVNVPTDNSSRYIGELERLNTMFLKGRITEEKYDTEYSRLQTLLEENKARLEAYNPDKIEKLKEIFCTDWQEQYNQLSKLNKKIFWKQIIKKVELNEDMTVKEVFFL